MWARSQSLPQPMTRTPAPIQARRPHRWPALNLLARPLCDAEAQRAALDDALPPPPVSLTAVPAVPLIADPRSSEARKASLGFIMNGSSEQSRPATAPVDEFTGEASGRRPTWSRHSSPHAWEAWEEAPIKQECVSPNAPIATRGSFGIGSRELESSLQLAARQRLLPMPSATTTAMTTARAGVAANTNHLYYALPPIDAWRRAAIYSDSSAGSGHTQQRVEGLSAVAALTEQRVMADRPQERRQYQRRLYRADQYDDPHDRLLQHHDHDHDDDQLHHNEQDQQHQQVTRKANSRSTTYEEKRRARECKVDGCRNYIINKGLCFRHGGGKKCTIDGCTSSAKNAGKCWKHGGSVKCLVDGCERRGKSRGFCWAHGGGTKCAISACIKVAVSNGCCWAHGGGKRCAYEGCSKAAFERTFNYCAKHHDQLKDGNETLEV